MPPVPYATKGEPYWDSQDGNAGTFGWDPAVIQIGFEWTRGVQALVKLLNTRLAVRGWEMGPEPCWGDDFAGVATWEYLRGAVPLEALALDSPIENDEWQVELQAKPQGQLIGCSPVTTRLVGRIEGPPCAPSTPAPASRTEVGGPTPTIADRRRGARTVSAD